ncbi:hypothetical protein D018_3760B, partial [Vibrio parahaemolyticus VP2007-007]
FNA